MGTYFKLLRQHGLKMWIANLLGFFATTVIVGIFALIIFGILFGIAAASIGNALTVGDPEAIGEALVGMGVGILIAVLIGILLFTVLSLFIYSFVYAGSYAMVNEIVLDGVSSIGTYFRSGFRYLGRMFLHMFLLVLVLIPFSVPAIVGEVLSLISYFNDNDTGTLIWRIVAFIGWILVVIASLGSIHGPVIMTAENKGAWESLTLSYKLIFKSFGKVLVTCLCLFAAVIVYMIISLPATVTNMLAESQNNLGLALLSLLFSLLLSLFVPFFQMANQLIVSLRYKLYLRKWVVPEEDLHIDGAVYGGDFNNPPFPQLNDPQAASWPETAATSPDHDEKPQADETPYENYNIPPFPSPGNDQPVNRKKDDSDDDEPPQNKYPKFPTDPHFK